MVNGWLTGPFATWEGAINHALGSENGAWMRMLLLFVKTSLVLKAANRA
jgi:hypothetical protein